MIAGKGVGLSLTTYRTVTEAPNVTDLEGLGYTVGANVTGDIPNTGFAGTSSFDVNFVPDKNGGFRTGMSRADGIASTGTSASIAAGVSYTGTLYSCNIFDELDKLYVKILE